MSQQDLHIDTILFAQIAQGDEKAFGEIFYKYTAKLFPFVSNLINSDAWAEEIVQDVFLKLWQARENLASVENPSAYLYQIASNRTMDYIKRNAKEVKLQYYVARQQNKQDKNFTQNDLDFREADAILKEAVNSLPPQRKKVYQMAREEGKTYEQIATELNISANTVRNHVSEALHEIRAYLQDKGAFTALFILAIKNIF